MRGSSRSYGPRELHLKPLQEAEGIVLAQGKGGGSGGGRYGRDQLFFPFCFLLFVFFLFFSFIFYFSFMHPTG